jgi:malonate transporter
MLAAFSALVSVVMLIVAGFWLRRTILPEEMQWNGIERLTYYILFPALIVNTLARADLARVPILGVGGALFLAILVMAGLCLALRPWLSARYAVGGPAFTSIMQGATRWNTFVALVLAASLFESLGVALASVAIVAMIPVLNVINVWSLARFASDRPQTGRAILGTLMGNPLIWSCVVGLLLNVLNVPFPQPIHLFADALGRASLACGLLSVGAGLQVAGLIRPGPAVLITTALKLVLMPVLALSLGLMFGVTGPSLAVIACCSAVPAPPGSYVMARQMGGDAVLLAQILTLQTMLAIVTMPIAIAIASLY